MVRVGAVSRVDVQLYVSGQLLGMLASQVDPDRAVLILPLMGMSIRRACQVKGLFPMQVQDAHCVCDQIVQGVACKS